MKEKRAKAIAEKYLSSSILFRNALEKITMKKIIRLRKPKRWEITYATIEGGKEFKLIISKNAQVKMEIAGEMVI